MTCLANNTKALLFVFAGVLSCGGTPVDQLEFPAEDYEVRFDLVNPKIVGIVDAGGVRDTLLLSQLEQRITRLTDLAPDVMNDPSQAQKMRKEILENFLQNHVLQIESKTRNLEVPREVLASEISEFKSRFKDTDTFKMELKSMGLTEMEFEADTRNRVKQNILLDSFRNEVAEPDKLAIDQYISEQQESRRLAHILFSFDRASSREDLKGLEELAVSVLDSLQSESDFGDFARRHSDDGSSHGGGDLGFVEKGQMVAEFEEAAFNLQNVGDISDVPVKTVFGLHIIKLISVKTNPPMDRNLASDRLFKTLRNDAVSRQIRLLKSKAVLHLNPKYLAQDLYK